MSCGRSAWGCRVRICMGLDMCVSIIQGVDADNSINDSWSELLELPKDPKMLHSVKDVRSPTLW